MSINADWEKFLDGPIKAVGRDPRVTISDRKTITFNRFIFDQLGKPEAVELFYNRREQKIGMKKTSPRFNEAFPIHRVRADSGTRYINAASFCIHHGINVTETHKFLRPDLIGDRMLVLNLNETIVVTRVRNRKDG